MIDEKERGLIGRTSHTLDATRGRRILEAKSRFSLRGGSGGQVISDHKTRCYGVDLGARGKGQGTEKWSNFGSRNTMLWCTKKFRSLLRPLAASGGLLQPLAASGVRVGSL